jgi:hypothetical protein
MARSEVPARSLVTAGDKQFLARFESCSLPEAEWTHLAHIRVAWVCLNLLNPDLALARIREGILRYNTEVLHRRHKYHETVTVAYTMIVAGRMSEGEAWCDFAEHIDDLLDSDSPILLGYYSKAMLFSDHARESFVHPDLEALPTWISIDGREV